ncbi:protein FAM221B [Glossophaga mutica]
MEADEVAEELHTTMDAEEHPSSKDPSARDSQEPPISETPLKASISETPLEPLTSETPLQPSSSRNPLETHTSETHLEPSISETPLEPHAPESQVTPSISHTLLETGTSDTLLEPSIFEARLEPHAPESQVTPSISHTLLETRTSETPLEPSISKASLEHSIPESPVEVHLSKVPEKQLTSHNASPDHVSGSPSDTLKEGPISESSSSDIPRTRRSMQIPESEFLQKHYLLGPSAQVHPDTSAKETEEEYAYGVDATDRATDAAQPGHHLGKKKEKKGVGRYRVSPVVPTKQAEMVKVANTVHRGMFDVHVRNLFQWEKNAALRAIQTGLYIGWRCPHYLWDCFRIGDESKCFCGHLLREHQIISDISVPCNVNQCRCLMFCFIPSRPEEVGQFWLRRRATFDPKAWRAQCRCKHNHEDHAATGSHPCRMKGCCCNCFESNFLCAACDRRWEEHQTFFETEETRRRGGRPHGADYVPFAEIPTLQETIISNSDFEILRKQGSSSHPSSHPSPPGFPGPRSLRPGPTSNRGT